MNQRTRFIIFLIAFILIVGFVAFALYVVFFRVTPQPPATTRPAAETGLPTLPQTGEAGERRVIATPTAPAGEVAPVTREEAGLVARGGTTKVREITTEQTSFSFVRRGAGDVVSYNAEKGTFVRTPIDGGPAQQVTDRYFPLVTDVAWAPTGDKAVITFPDQAKVYYDFTEQKQYSIPKHWDDITFSPDSSQIAFKVMHENPEKRWLAVGSPDGSNVQLVEPLGDVADKFTLAWSPNRQIVGVFTKPVGFDRQELFLVGAHGENLKSMYVEGFGIVPQWSPIGDRLLYSVYPMDLNQGVKPELWIVNAQGDNVGRNRIPLGIQTWADKCVFETEDAVICGVPHTLPTGAGAYRSLADGTPDDLYRINTRTGLTTFLAQPEESVRVLNPQISEDGSALLFIDGFTKRPFELRLQ